MNTDKLPGYIAFFEDQRTEIRARSSYEAQQKAIEHFRPSKRKKHLVHVHLAEINGEEVIHHPSELP